MLCNDVFISYSTKNSEVANHVRMTFESNGITCWMAPFSIPAGSSYTREIPYGILNSKLAVVIISSDSIKSVWVEKEIEYIVDNGKTIIPFIIDDISINCLEEPFLTVATSKKAINEVEDVDLSLLLLSVQRQLARHISPNESNNSDDLLQLGLRDIREDGGLLFDAGNAEKYLRKSAELGNPTAMRNLAELVWDIGTQEESEYWYDKAAEAGDIYAQERQASKLYYDGPQTPDNFAKATNMLQKGVSEHYVSSLRLCAELLLEKSNPYYNPTLAIQYLEEAIKNGESFAAILLGDIYRDGIYVQEDPGKAFKLYCSVAEEESLAVLRMGDCFFLGYGTVKDLNKAFEYYASNCDCNEEYLEKYGDCLNYGYGTEKDREGAIEAYRDINIGAEDDKELKNSAIHLRVLKKRMELEDGEAEAILGKFKLEDGNTSEAIEMFKKANSHDDPHGALYLGRLVLNGWETEVNEAEAFMMISRAYSRGIQEAAKDLAECYRTGKGIEMDTDKAAYFENVSTQDEFGIWSLSLMTKD